MQNTFGGNLLNAGAPKLRGKRREFKVESDCKWRVSEVLREENSLLYQQKRLAIPHESNAPN
jgi:hypothetical protein